MSSQPVVRVRCGSAVELRCSLVKTGLLAFKGEMMGKGVVLAWRVNVNQQRARQMHMRVARELAHGRKRGESPGLRHEATSEHEPT